jgi:hypothetical protein
MTIMTLQRGSPAPEMYFRRRSPPIADEAAQQAMFFASDDAGRPVIA